MRRVWIGLGSFAAGIALTAFVMANPLHWGWLRGSGSPPGAAMDEMAHPREPTVQGASSPERESGSERKIKYWRAPMDPTFISDKPGKSPMGMDLIPVYEGEEQEIAPGTIKIDPVFVQNIGVVSEKIERTDIPFTIRTVGTLTYDDSQIAWIGTKYEGWIERVYVNYVGEPVNKGQKLFEIYSPQLVTTQNEYLQARDYARRMEQSVYPDIARRAQSLLSSSRERLKYWDITDEQIAELEEDGALRRTLAVVSSVNGLVVEKMNQALEGMFVKPGMNLYQIADLSTIWVHVNVFENQIPWLKIGSRAVIELPYESGRKLVGRVRYLYPFFDEKTRSLKISIELPNPGQKLRANMYVNVTFDVPSAKNVVAVPEEAVIHSGQRTVVVIDRGNGTYQAKEVTLGVNGGGLWEVKEGLEAGDRVVVSAQFLIDSESNLREAIRKMTSGVGSAGVPAPGSTR
jgi:membrane fusion protein, copper/silver efflux system